MTTLGDEVAAWLAADGLMPAVSCILLAALIVLGVVTFALCVWLALGDDDEGDYDRTTVVVGG